MLSADTILKARPEIRQVLVPELAGSVFVRALSAGERDRFEVAHLKSGETDFRARLAAACVCDADGTLLFCAADVAGLSAVPAGVLEPIVQEAIALNRLDAKAIEDLRKN